MKKLAITTLFLLSFAGMAFSGFSMMSHTDEGTGNCVASKVSATAECPASGLAMVLHHVAAYQSFLTVLITQSIMVTLLILALVIIAVYLGQKIFSPPRYILRQYRWRFLYNFVSTQLQKITGWLSLLENSPFYARQRA